MSFKIFLLQLTGKIKSTETIENKRNQLETDYSEFLKTESSAELKSFLELEKYVKSDDFIQKRKKTEGLTFKGSNEEKQLKEFNKLQKFARIRNFLKVAESSDLIRYEKESEGEKIAEFRTLKKYVKEGELEKDKKEIKSETFKGSAEEKKWKEFRQLEKSAQIKAYRELNGTEKLKKHELVRHSEKLKRFNELKNTGSLEKEQIKEYKELKKDAEIKAWLRFEKSKKLKFYNDACSSKKAERYMQLKEYVISEDYKKRETYLKDKKKFEKSEAYQKLEQYKKLKNDETINFIHKYRKSKLYKNYLSVKDSTELKRYAELKGIVESDEYKERKVWLEDKKRWEKTDDFKKYQQYEQDKKKPEFVKYFKYKDSTDFDFFRNWDVVFEDSFDAGSLNAEKWSTVKASAKAVGENIAMPGDLGIFSSSGNVKTGNGLSIISKKEKSKGMVWQLSSGLMPTNFEYTSGMITSAGSFDFNDGIVEAKIKFNPVKQLASSFYFTAGSDMPRVNLVETGVRNSIGFSVLNNGKVKSTGLDIANLKNGTYIFSLEKKGSAFVWSINETEVLQLTNTDFNKPLELNAASLVVDAISDSSVNFEVEWVKCYCKK